MVLAAARAGIAVLVLSLLGAVSPAIATVQGAREKPTANSSLASPPSTAGASIIKGTSTSAEAFPWLAFIQHENDDGRSDCTGTVVAPRVVLTAGHCVQNLERGGIRRAEGFAVATSMADLKQATEVNFSSVTQALIFPGFDPSHLFNDAGLLVLSAPVAAPSLPLATPSDSQLWAEGAPIEIAGWGKTIGRASKGATVLREAETIVQSTGYCRRQTRRFTPFYSPSGQLCAIAPPKFEVGSCHGDSGGPGIARRQDGSPVQIGIISLGASGCSPELPEVLARVDQVSSWVASWIAAVELGAPPPAVKIPRVVLPRLSIPDAKQLVALGLAVDFKYRFLRGRGHRIQCGRIERGKVKCRPSWLQGGNDYYGTVTVYTSLSSEGVGWDYRYKIHWVDDYCWFYSGHRQTCVIRTRTR